MVEQGKALTATGPGEDGKTWLRKLTQLETQEGKTPGSLPGEQTGYGPLQEASRPDPTVPKGRRRRASAHKGEGRSLEQLERDREALLDHYARIVPKQLDVLEPEERNRVYKILALTMLAHENGNLELMWALGADPCRDNEPPPPDSCRTRGR